MEIIYLVIGLIVGAVIVFLFLKSRRTIPVEEANQLSEQINSLKIESGKFSERIKLLDSDKSSLLSELKTEREKSEKLTSENSSLKSDYSNLQQKLTEQKAEIEELQQKFTKEFENLANRIFDDKTKRFSEQSKTNLAEILNPLKEKISEFQNKVEETNKESISRTSALREQLQNLKDMNQQMSTDAQNLVKALKGDTKAQGDWGEIQLERILERSGLRKGEEYIVQESYTSEDGSRKRPDVIINLPEEKKIIIDSKVSLVSYERLVSADDDDQRSIHIKAFIDSVKKHIKELSEKNYQSIFDHGTLDFVLMFIPIEPAFSLAIQYGENLYVDAYDKNIIIVSPSTLLATLRTIANIWKQEYQNKNVIEIAKQSGALYDKFVAFTEDLISVGNRIDQAKGTYVDAMKKLTEGPGNLVKRAEKIKKLGAKSTKTLPPNVLNRADLDDDTNLLDN
jgi:DNA recombination protein RmuC